MELYVVLATSLIVWISLFVYMSRLDAKIRELEERK